MRALTLFAALLFVLAGCGQKGPLFMPQPPDDAPTEEVEE